MSDNLTHGSSERKDRPAQGRIECDGGPYCQASPHIHGCFADKGDCDEPAEHDSDYAALGKEHVEICRLCGGSGKAPPSYRGKRCQCYGSGRMRVLSIRECGRNV